MRPTLLRSALRRHLAWLLGLALLLPLAQLVSVGHGYAHVRSEAPAQHEGKQAPGAAHCGQCLAAAAIAGGALASPSLLPALRPARHAPPRPAAQAACCAWRTPAYRSRAPPLPLR
jgi:hypothetical protein